jgi:hypothetical protein
MALATCEKLGLGDDVPAETVYLALRALQTGKREFLRDAVELFRDHRRPVRKAVGVTVNG